LDKVIDWAIKRPKSFPIWISIITLIVWIVACVNASMTGEPKIGNSLAILLLAMPVTQPIVLIILAFRPSSNGEARDGLLNVLSILMSLSIFIFSLGWLLYSWEIFREGLWAGGVFAAIVLAGLALSLVGRQGWLNAAIRQHNLLLAFFFLGLFLSVSYCITFAFALHDKQQRSKTPNPYYGLCAAPLPLSPPKETPAQTTQGDTPTQRMPRKEPTYLPSEPASEQTERSRMVKTDRLLFRLGSAEIDTDSKIAANPSVESHDTTSLRCEHNARSLARILNGVSKFDSHKLRITLVGHTDETEFKQSSDTAELKQFPYKTNYELAAARANATLLSLSKKLPRAVDEWLIVPTSYGKNNFLGKKPTKPEPGDQDPGRNWRSVEVLVEASGMVDRPGDTSSSTTQPRDPLQLPAVANVVNCDPLSLNDYIYFTVYTITTTGYGDIRPVTSQAKFITCIANLLEVVFLVIFFNVLLGSSMDFDGTKGAESEKMPSIENLSKRLDELTDQIQQLNDQTKDLKDLNNIARNLSKASSPKTTDSGSNQ
jgi:Ion channel